MAACDANPDCLNLLVCATACTDSTCMQNCMNLYPGGLQQALAVQACICQPSVCSLDCAVQCAR